ncbi:hypothetical protein QUF75_14420 [Desulfococcaceae bacterium HSG7]|nr:hypothetical protein [Desulfococcaceae bacterium HSG7]
MTKLFVPQEFIVPKSFVTEQYCLEMLSPSVTEIDYDAVMTSKIRLRTVFSEKTEWPKDDMSLEENRRDLQKHALEFKSRQAFAYTVLTLSKEKCIEPTHKLKIREIQVKNLDADILVLRKRFQNIAQKMSFQPF